MWCTANANTCSSGVIVISIARATGPVARSNGAAVKASTSATAASSDVASAVVSGIAPTPSAAGSTIMAGRPSSVEGKRVRSGSCRAATWFNAAASAAGSTVPRRRHASGIVYAVVPGA
jgi:hypothetical protein